MKLPVLFFLFPLLLFGTELIAQVDWQPRTQGLNTAFRSFDMTSTPNGELIAVGYKRIPSSYNALPAIYSSKDSGKTWSEDTLPGAKARSYYGAICSVGDALLIANGTEGFNNGCQVYKSIDDGNSWTCSNFGLPNGFSIWDFEALNNGKLLASGTTRLSANDWLPAIYESSDTGISWNVLKTSGLPETGQFWAVKSTGINLLLSSGHSIYKSEDDGLHWSIADFPMNSFIYKMEALPSGVVLGVGVQLDTTGSSEGPRIISSDNYGEKWSIHMPVGIPSSLFYSALTCNGHSIFMNVVGSENKIYQSPLELSSLKEILSFNVPGMISQEHIKSDKASVWVQVDASIDLSQLVPSIEVSNFASIYPGSDTAIDLSSPTDFVVTAQNGSTKIWRVTVSNKPDAIGNLQQNKPTIFPNPCFSCTRLHISPNGQTITNISITDIQGRLLWDKMVDMSGFYDISALPAGLFFIQFVRDTQMSEKQIVIIHK